MAIAIELGERRVVRVAAGAIAYRERASGPAIVFVHGVGMNADLWRHLVPRLADQYRCIAPDLPWGSHSIPLHGDTDLSLPEMARITADFLQALDLDHVTLVANDTGGAVSKCLSEAIGNESAGLCSPRATPSRSSRRHRRGTCNSSRVPAP